MSKTGRANAQLVGVCADDLSATVAVERARGFGVRQEKGDIDAHGGRAPTRVLGAPSQLERKIAERPGGKARAVVATLVAIVLPLSAFLGFLPQALVFALWLLGSRLLNARARYGKPARLGSLDVASLAIIPSVTVLASAGLTVAGYLREDDPTTSWLFFGSSVAFAITLAAAFANTIGKHRSGEAVLAFEPDVDGDPKLRALALKSLSEMEGPRAWLLRSRTDTAQLAAERDVKDDFLRTKRPSAKAVAMGAWRAGRGERYELVVLGGMGVAWTALFVLGVLWIGLFPYLPLALLSAVSVPAWAVLSTGTQYEDRLSPDPPSWWRFVSAV